MSQTTAPTIQLGPFERWLQARVPVWLLRMWVLGLRGASPVPLGQRLKGLGCFGLAFGFTTLLGLWFLWLATRLALIAAAAILTAGLLTRDAWRARG